MKNIKLEEIVNIYLGLTHTPKYVEKGVPFLSVKDISNGKIDFSKCHYITEEEYDKLPNGAKPQRGDILFCRVGTIGKPIIIEENLQKFGSFVSLGFLRLKNTNYSLKYIKYWMNSDCFMKQVKKNVKGVAQVNLNTGWLSKFDIPMYELSMQKEIVNRLNHASDLITLRKGQIKQLDLLIKSQFVEMFGMLTKNEKKWEIKKTEEICEKITDGAHYSPRDKGKGYPMLSVKDMRNDGFHYENCKYISAEDYEKLKNLDCIPKKNDILISKDGSYFYYGFVVEKEKEEAVLSSIAILRPNIQIINPHYLRFYMLSTEIRDYVSKNYVTGSALKRVILKGIKAIPVIVPPIELQNQFADFVKQVDKLKFVCTLQLHELQCNIYSEWGR